MIADLGGNPAGQPNTKVFISYGQPKARVFISYSRKDMTFADRLEAALKVRAFDPLIDRTEILAFEDWWQSIQTLIARSDTVVFVLSPDAVTSDVVLQELRHAASLNKRFLPIVYRRVEDGALPEALPRSNFILFDDPANFEASADHLAAALQIDIAWIRQHTEYSETARRWRAHNHPDSLLLRSPALEEAERWIVSRPHTAPAVAMETKAFVAESRRIATRTRRRVLALVSVVAATIAAGFAAWWNQERIYLMAAVSPLTSLQERALKVTDSFKECTDCPEMIVVPTGSFMMGSPASPVTAGEQPRHKVTIVKPFAVAKFELIFDEWDACATHGNCVRQVSDRGWGRGRRPVINVNWNDAQDYIGWLSRITGKTYRLLSEAEHEYAARGGKQPETIYPWGNEIGRNNANCRTCGSQWDYKQTAPVGSFAPNGFGLYDMVGNVSEWTEDCYNKAYNGAPADGSAWTSTGDCNLRLIRGGSYYLDPQEIRSARRFANQIGSRSDTLGIRVARTLIAP